MSLSERDRRRPVGHGVRRLVDKALLGMLDKALGRSGIGRLQLTLPSGEIAVLGQPDGSGATAIVLNNYRVLWKLMRGGLLGFAESYMDGDFATDDLKAVFDCYLANEQAMSAAVPALVSTRRSDRRFHLSRANTRAGSRRNIAAHYDLGNAFYRLWLDKSMSYSSGIYPGADASGLGPERQSKDASLEVAQQEKHDHILAALDLQRGQSLLEIGCGWGALAEAAGRRGADVTAITISREQHAEASARIEAAGLRDSVEIRFQDYRDVAGAFDRIVSIEMIEAVGEEHWPLYFRAIADRLRPGGSAVIQAITIREDIFELYRQKPDFIQRYIFPGGMLPTVDRMRQGTVAEGLGFEELERFGASYALTLADWRRRFDAAWPRIEAMGFDQRFRRMWSYYMIYCEVGFERGLIDVGLYRIRKPG